MNIRMSWILNYIPSQSNRSDKYARKQWQHNIKNYNKDVNKYIMGAQWSEQNTSPEGTEMTFPGVRRRWVLAGEF